jgi:broad specificity phosphatase PhoE
MTRLFLLRHGQTAGSGAVLQGRLAGISLNAEGLKQAEHLRDLLPSEISSIITSPVQRARETASIVAAGFGLKVVVDEAFSELNFGVWQGLSFEELETHKEWKEFNLARVLTRAPQGENLSDVERRVFERLHTLLDGQSEAVAIVTHGDIIRVALTDFVGAPLDCFDRFRIDTGSLTEIECFPDGMFRVVRLNYR